MKIISQSNYTIYIPTHPSKMIIYVNAHISFPAGNGKVSKTKYNYREEVVEALYNNETIAVAGLYSKKLLEVILQIREEYHISEVLVSGWSAGGNDALTIASALNGLVQKLKVLLIDSNHTNNVAKNIINNLQNIEINNVSNNLNKTKLKKLQKVLDTGMFKHYFLLSIPKSFKGSHHRYCRDSSLDNKLFYYILNNEEIDLSQYQIWTWDNNKKEMVL